MLRAAHGEPRRHAGACRRSAVLTCWPPLLHTRPLSYHTTCRLPARSSQCLLQPQASCASAQGALSGPLPGRLAQLPVVAQVGCGGARRPRLRQANFVAFLAPCRFAAPGVPACRRGLYAHCDNRTQLKHACAGASRASMPELCRPPPPLSQPRSQPPLPGAPPCPCSQVCDGGYPDVLLTRVVPTGKKGPRREGPACCGRVV